jgi:hypothetical protein
MNERPMLKAEDGDLNVHIWVFLDIGLRRCLRSYQACQSACLGFWAIQALAASAATIL